MEDVLGEAKLEQKYEPLSPTPTHELTESPPGASAKFGKP